MIIQGGYQVCSPFRLAYLGQFLDGHQANAFQEVLQVLDIILKELPTQ
jgi:hypothetical protein